MIKFVGQDKTTGRQLVGFGLSRGNIEKLQQMLPIQINLEEMKIENAPGYPWRGDILIFFGETEAEMASWLEEMIGPNTKLTVDPRLKS